MAAHVFTPPITQAMSWSVTYFGDTPPDAEPGALAIAKYLASGRRADNVYVMVDGSVTTQQPPNWSPSGTDYPNYAHVWSYPGSSSIPQHTVFTLPPNLTVKSVYYGGHTSPVPDDDYAFLVAAGYGPPELV
jgi:hypothetical protein